jgi:YVTN family beta-propeller protein
MVIKKIMVWQVSMVVVLVTLLGLQSLMLGGSAYALIISSPSNKISIGTVSAGIAVNPETNMLYVTDLNSGTISVINDSTHGIVANITVGKFPWGIAVNPKTNMIYVANQFSNSVSVIDGSTNKVIQTVAVGKRPVQVAINPKTNMVYVSDWNYPYGGLSVINGSTNRLAYNMQGMGGSSFGIAVNPDTNRIYVNNFAGSRGSNSTVSVLDGSNNSIIDNITIDTNKDGGVSTIPDAVRVVPIAVNPDTNIVYAADFTSPKTVLINGSTNVVIGSIMSGAKGFAIDSKTNTVFMASSGQGCVYSDCDNSSEFLYALNGSSNKVVDKIKLDGDVTGLAINPNTNTVYVENTFGTISAIDAAAATTSLSVPEFPSTIFHTSIATILGVSLLAAIGIARAMNYSKRQL